MLHVRVTNELKARLEAEARAAGRSMNAEIMLRLRDSLRLPSKDDSEREEEANVKEETQVEGQLGLAFEKLKALKAAHPDFDESSMLDAMRQIYLELFGLANERAFRRLSSEIKENFSSERLGHLEKKVDLLIQKLDLTDDA